MARDACILLDSSSYDSACNRAYYAMFDAAGAVLIARGHAPGEAKTHATVLRLFSENFVRSGPLDPEIGRILRRAGGARLDADYADRATTQDEAREILGSMERFMGAVEPLLRIKPGDQA